MNNLSFLFAAKTLDQESIKLLDGDLNRYHFYRHFLA